MEYKIFRAGEPVTAEFMTDLVKDVVDAENNAAEAKAKAAEMERKAANGEFDGKTICIKYNTSPTDVGASDTWQEGMNYIGFAMHSDAVAPSTGFSWAKFTGPVGAAGPQGPVGPAPDLSDYVNVNTSQTIAAAKTFSAQITFASGAKMGKWTVATNASNELVFTYVG